MWNTALAFQNQADCIMTAALFILGFHYNEPRATYTFTMGRHSVVEGSLQHLFCDGCPELISQVHISLWLPSLTSVKK